jgi:hypothetical protein
VRRKGRSQTSTIIRYHSVSFSLQTSSVATDEARGSRDRSTKEKDDDDDDDDDESHVVSHLLIYDLLYARFMQMLIVENAKSLPLSIYFVYTTWSNRALHIYMVCLFARINQSKNVRYITLHHSKV